MARSSLMLGLVFVLASCVSTLGAQTVTSTSPTANDESVPRNANIGASFSSNMQGGSASNFIARGRQHGTRTGIYGGAGTSTLTFNPDVDLGPNEQVFVSLTTGLQTTGSQPLAAPYVYRIRGEAGWGPRDFGAFAEDIGQFNTGIVVAGDMNGDGSTDLVVAGFGLANAILLNDGFGNFIWSGSQKSFGPGNGLTAGLDIGDVDGDGDLDVLASDSTQNRWVYFNDGAANLTSSNLPGSASGQTGRARLADLDGDGDLDAIICATVPQTGLFIYLNAGNGTFGAPANYGTIAQPGLDVGDIDGDGDMDLATARDYFFNDGTGAFPTVVITGTGNAGADSHLADIDGDGDLDHVLVGGSGSFLTQVWKNNGTGSFNLFQTIGTNQDHGVGLGDIDGDGDLDMIRCRSGVSLAAQVYLNNGSGTFSYFSDISGPAPTDAYGCVLADFDHDADLDLVLGRGSGSNRSFVHLNTALDQDVLLQNGPLSEPSTIDSVSGAAGYTSVFDFQLVDQGSAAGQSTRLGRVVVRVAGSADAVDHQWQLVPQGFSPVAGTVGGGVGNRTVTFDLNSNIANGTSLVFTLQVQLATNPASTTDNESFQVSLATSDIKLYGGSQFQTGQGTLTPSPLSYNVIATALEVTGHPPASVAIGNGFTVSAEFVDASGNTDLDVNGDVLTAVRSDSGTVNSGQSSPAVQGVVVFAGATSISLGTPAATGIHLILTDDSVGSTNLSGSPVNTNSFDLLDLPLLQGVTPTPNTHGAPTSASIVGSFDRNMGAATSGTMRVQTSGRGVLPGNYSGGGTTDLTFVPGSSLLPGEIVEVTFTSGLQSTGALSLANPTVARFRAAAGAGPAYFKSKVQQFGTSTTYRLCLLADIDGDGDLDLISSTSAGQLHTHENVNGVLETTGVAYGATFAYSDRACAGDYDLDGDVDVLMQYGTQMLIYSNNGAGVFSAGTPFGATSGTSQIRVGDLDADGDLDIVRSTSGGFDVYFNNGSGAFPSTSSIPTPGFYDFELADLDGDGDLDVVTAVNGVNAILFNDGTGAFPYSATWGGGGANTRQVATGDVDGDGDLDLVLANFSSTKEVWLNNGAASFLAGTQFSSPSIHAGWFDLADMDGDGDLDVVVGSGGGAGAANNYLYLNDGTGDYGASASQIALDTTSFDTYQGAAGDIDGDGDLDFVTANSNDGAQVQYNHYTRIDVTEAPASHTRNAPANSDLDAQFSATATGASASTFVANGAMRGRLSGTYSGNGSSVLTFDPSTDFLPGEEVSVTLTTGINVGGNPVAYPFVWHFRTEAGTGPGYFAAISSPATPGGTCYVAEVGDLDGDTDIDVVIGHGSAVYVLVNDGSNTFSTTTLSHSGQHRDVALFDRDGDGDLDIVAINTSGSLQLWTNVGGVFVASTSLAGGDRGLRAGDMNGDGWPDLVTGQYVFFNNGSGGFTASASEHYRTNGYVQTFGLIDFDKDGDLDVVGFDNNDNGIIYLNDSNGVFSQSKSFAALNSVGHVAFGDMDGNGFEDLVATSGASTARIYWNNGVVFAGTYTTPNGGGAGRQPVVADIDGDGDLDIAVANNNTQNALFLNNGSGVFTSGTSFGATGQQGFGIAAADFDADGDLDLVTACVNGAGRVYFNDNPGPASVVSTTPTHESGSGSRNSNPTVHFNRDMGAATNVTLPAYSPFQGRLSGNYFTQGKDVTLNHGGFFANDEVTMIVTTALQDSGGTAVSSPWLMHYRTSSSGLGDANFSSPVNLGGASSATTALVFGDVDADGDLDAIVGTYGGPNTLYYNDGTGAFGTSLQIGPGNDNTRALAMADINRDGRVDIVVGNDGQSVVYLNAASNPFTTSTNIGSGGSTAGISIGDLDGNGSIDIVLADDGGQNRWFPNNFGTLGTPVNFGSGSDASRAVALADLDLDGDLDMVVANNGAANQYYLNTSGTFGSGNSISSSNFNTLAMAFADLNGDNYPDLVFGNDGQSEYFLNSGGSGFGSGNSIGGASDVTTAVALGDFDGDGSLDIALANDGAQDAVYLNSGSGSFGSAKPFGGTTTVTRAIAAIDTDGNDILELATGAFQQQGQIFTNDFVPTLDADATVSASSALTEPTTIDSVNGAASFIPVLDFTIADGGTADGYPTLVSAIAINRAGSALLDWAEWQLSGPGLSGPVAVTNTSSKVIFFNLGISVADGTSATYTVSMKLKTTVTLTDNTNWQLSLDDTDLSTTYPCTTFATSSAVDNGSGLTLQVEATELRMQTQPPAQATTGFPFDVYVRYTDIFGNLDADVTDTVTFARSDSGGIASATSSAAVAGVAGFWLGGSNAVVLTGTATGITLDFTDDATGITASGVSSASFNLVGGILWTGATSTDWHDATNWSSSAVPTNSTSVTIPASAANMPVLTAPAVIYAVLVESGASLSLASFQLSVYGNLIVDGTVNPGTGILRMLSGSKLSGSVVVDVYQLNVSSTVQLYADLDVAGDITGNGSIGGQGSLIRFVGTSAQSSGSMVTLQAHVRNSNTSAVVTIARTITFDKDKLLTIDSGAQLALNGSTVILQYDTGTSTSPLTNNGTLVFGVSSNITNTDVDLGDVVVLPGAQAVLQGGWGTVNTGALTTQLNTTSGARGRLHLLADSDLSGTTLVNDGLIRCVANGSFTLVPPASGTIGDLELAISGGTSGVTVSGSLVANHLTLISSAPCTFAGDVTLTGDFTGTGTPTFNGLLTMAGTSPQTIDGQATGLTLPRLQIAGGADVTVANRLGLSSIVSGASRALTVNATGAIELSPGAILELGQTGGTAEVLVNGEWRTSSASWSEPASTRGTSATDRWYMAFGSGSETNVDGWRLSEFGDSTQPYGLDFQAGATITGMSGLEVLDCEASTAMIRFDAITAPTNITGLKLTSAAGGNIDATNYAGSVVSLFSSSTGTGTRFGATFEIDPGNRLDWFEVPLFQQGSPQRNTYSAGAGTDVAGDFNHSMAAPAADQFTVHGSYGGRVSGTVSGAGTTTLSLQPSIDFLPGEEVEVHLGLGMQDTAGSGTARDYTYRFRVRPTGGTGVFAPTTLMSSYAANSNGIVMGDVDRDGDLDIVNVRDWSGIVGPQRTSVYINDGYGRFTWWHNVDLGDAENAVLVDLDGDGWLDIAAVSDNRIRLVYNNGAGRLDQNPTDTGPTTTTGTYIEAGDLNGDGYPDLVASYGPSSGSQDIVLVNDGTGGFPAPWVQLGNANSRGIAIGDIDGDYDLDVLIGEKLHNNDGSGAFLSSDWITGFGISPALGDYDGDGDLDIAAGSATSSGQDTIYTNDGSGVFTAGATLGAPGFNTQRVLTGDVDGDGQLDLLIYGSQYNIRVFINQGGGSFAGPAVLSTTNDLKQVVLGDIDADGDLDIVSGHSANLPKLYFNDGRAPQSPLLTSTSPARHAENAASDVNVSAVFDNPIGTPAPGNFRVHGALTGWRTVSVTTPAANSMEADPALNLLPGEPAVVSIPYGLGPSGLATVRGWQWGFHALPAAVATMDFTQASVVLGSGSEDTRALALGDFDGDGDVDVAVAVSGAQNLIFFNDGSGAFPSVVSFGGATDDTRALIAFDIDADGDLDLVEGNYGQINNVYTNNAGAFTQAATFGGVGDNTTGLAYADFDLDGDLDFAVSNDGQQNSVYFNNGSGGFPTQLDLGGATTNSRFVVVGDVDLDYRPDVLFGNNAQDSPIFVHDATGAIVPGHVFTGNVEWGAIYDHDGDGDLDVMIAYTGGSATFFEGNGSGVYSSTSTGTRGVFQGDINGDGRLDFGIYRNGINSFAPGSNSTSGFSSFSWGPTSNPYNSLGAATADFNGDGKLDILEITGAGEPTTIYFDQLPGAYVQSMTPANMRIAQATVAPEVKFSHAMNAADDTKWPVYSNLRGKLTGTYGISFNQRDLWFTPASPLLPGERLDLTVTTQMTRAGGGPLQAPAVWTLTARTGSSIPDMTVAVSNVGGASLATMAAVAADFDGDGDIDIALATDNTGDTVVYFNDGTGSFPTSVTVSSGLNTRALWACDLDRDGDVDLVEGNYGQPNYVYLNSGGAFGGGTSFGPGNDATAAIAVGDIDGDGNLDVFAGNDGQQDVAYFGDGTGGFTGSQNFGGASTSTRAVAMMNPYVGGQNRPAIFVGDYGGQNVVWFPGGTGYATRLFGTGTDHTVGLALADFDGDNTLDVLVVNGNGEADSVCLEGYPNYQSPQAVNNAADSFAALAGDFNGDNNWDALIARDTGNGSQLFDGDGQAGFNLRQTFANSMPATALAAADFDGDGDLDLLLGVNGQSSVRLSGGTAPQLQSTNPLAYHWGASRTGPYSATFDNTMAVPGANHVVVRGARLGTIGGTRGASGTDVSFIPGAMLPAGEMIEITLSPTLQDSNGSYLGDSYVWRFATATAGSPGLFNGGTTAFGQLMSSIDIAVADLDGDGDVDVLTYEGTAGGHVFLNQGGGVFSPGSQITTQFRRTGTGILLADLDNDGDLDLLPHASGGAMLLNNGSGVFVAGPNLPNGRALCTADLDGDGDTDIVWDNQASPAKVEILENDGAGNFATTGPIDPPFGVTPSSALVEDFNLDGKLDLIAGNELFHNDGNLRFVFSQNIGASIILDIDNDGDMDTIAGNLVYLNNGSALVTGAYTNPFSTSHAFCETGDIDGDGDMDLLFRNATAGTYHIQRNDGGVTFTQLPPIPGASVASSAGRLADLDGNGTLDFVAAKNGGGIYVVWQGDGPVVTGIQPGNGAAATGTATPTVTFDRAIDTSSAGSGSMQIHGSLTGRRAGTLTFNAGNDEMTLTPATNLLPGEFVEVSVPAGLLDTSSNPLPRSYSWRYYTTPTTATGVFTSTVALSGADPSRCVVAGDVDGDGDIDLVVANFNGQDYVYINTAGTFSATALGGTTTASVSIALGDVDGDGDLDIAIGRSGGAGELFSNSGGAFSSISSLPSDISACHFADITGDGLPELLTTSGYLVNSTGGFGTSQAWQLGGTVTGTLTALTTADFNGDGTIDVALGHSGSGQAIRVLHTYDGVLVHTLTISAPSDVLDLEAGDLDGDGAIELVAVLSGQKPRVYGMGAVALTATPLEVGVAGDNSVDAEVHDIDGDGDFDLLLAGGTTRVMLYTGGAFLPGATLNPGSASSICVADVDGDGRLDVAVARDGFVSQVFINTPPSSGAQDAVVSVSGTPVATIDSISGASGINAVFNFQIQDQGTLDALSTDILDLAVLVSGTGDASEHIWSLSGGGLTPIAGIYTAQPTPRILFNSVGISVPSGSSSVFTVSVTLDPTPASTSDNDSFTLTIDPAAIVFGTGSTIAGTVDNGGLTYEVTATRLMFATQPAGVSAGATLTTQPVLWAADAAGNTDLDSTGSVDCFATTVAPGPVAPVLGSLSRPLTAGVATFTDLQVNIPGLQYILRVQAGPFQADSIPFNVSGGSGIAQPPVFYNLYVDDPDNAYRAGEQISFTANLGVSGLTVTADLSVVDTTFAANLSLTDNTDGTYSLTSPALSAATLIEGINLTVLVTASNGSLSTDKALLVTVDDTAPVAALSLNRPASSVPAGVLRVTLTADELLYGAPLISISGVTGAQASTSEPMSGSSPSASWRYDYTLPPGATGTGTISIAQAADVTGNVATVAAQQFTATGASGGLLVDAGGDIQIDLPQRVNLSGSGTQGATGFTWTQVGGPVQVSIVNAATSAPHVDLIKSGTYSFQLEATDGTDTAVDVVNVVLQNSAPEVEAGRDHNIIFTDVVTTGSQFFTVLPIEATVFDANGDNLALRWDMLSAPPSGNLFITSPGSAVSTIEVVGSTMAPGVYVIGLRVQDTTALKSDTWVGDTVRIVVTSPTVVPPNSHSGFQIVVPVGVASELDGHESADPDAVNPQAPGLSYFWTLERRPPGSGAVLVDVTQEKPHITPDVPGVYIFSLVTVDVDGYVSGRDFVRLIANQTTGANANTIPRGVATASYSDLDSNGSLNVTEPVVLSAANSVDGENHPITYLWRQIGGPALVFLPDPTATMHNVQFQSPGVYGFRVAVRDTIDEGIPAELWIQVAAAGTATPVAAGGIDAADDSNSDGYVLVIPGVGVDNNAANPEVNLNASGSFVDPGLTAEYQWAQTRGPTTALSGANTTNLAFTPLISRVYEFELTVRDSNGVTARRIIVVAIDTWDPSINPTGNAVPRVTSGPAQTVTANTVVTLAGTATDPNNTTLFYIWEQTSGPPVVLDMTNPLMPTFTAPINGTYEFRLYVDDGYDISPGFDIVITAQPGGGTGPGGGSGEGDGGNDGGCSTGQQQGGVLLLLAILATAGMLIRRVRRARTESQ